MALSVKEKVKRGHWEEVRGHWEEENKKTTSETRRMTARSNLKLSKFKDGNHLSFTLFKYCFANIIFEMLTIFTKLLLSPKQ